MMNEITVDIIKYAFFYKGDLYCIRSDLKFYRLKTKKNPDEKEEPIEDTELLGELVEHFCNLTNTPKTAFNKILNPSEEPAKTEEPANAEENVNNETLPLDNDSNQRNNYTNFYNHMKAINHICKNATVDVTRNESIEINLTKKGNIITLEFLKISQDRPPLEIMKPISFDYDSALKNNFFDLVLKDYLETEPLLEQKMISTSLITGNIANCSFKNQKNIYININGIESWLGDELMKKTEEVAQKHTNYSYFNGERYDDGHVEAVTSGKTGEEKGTQRTRIPKPANTSGKLSIKFYIVFIVEAILALSILSYIINK